MTFEALERLEMLRFENVKGAFILVAVRRGSTRVVIPAAYWPRLGRPRSEARCSRRSGVSGNGPEQVDAAWRLATRGETVTFTVADATRNRMNAAVAER